MVLNLAPMVALSSRAVASRFRGCAGAADNQCLGEQILRGLPRSASELPISKPKIMRKLGVSRNELFAKINRPALEPLPATPMSVPSGRSAASRPIITSRSPIIITTP